jgi:hypothetical protein
MLSNASGLDIDANPRTTGTVSMAPSVPCAAAGFTNNRCLGGTNEGQNCSKCSGGLNNLSACTVASQCPGGSCIIDDDSQCQDGGTCEPQCFCSGQLKPNACDAACVGGLNNKAGCVVDTECPGGFCHPADCRLDPSDLTSNQEGICTSGPSTSFCSHTTYKTCGEGFPDQQCRPPLCPFCQPDETCKIPTLRACFINSGIIRIGTPRTLNLLGDLEGESAGLYCIPSNSSAFNAAAGFPGPGALIQREKVIVVGVPTPVPTPP